MSSYITNNIGLSNVNEHYCHFYFKVRLSGWTFPLSFSNFRHLSWSPLEWVPDLFTFSQMVLKIAWSPGLCLIASHDSSLSQQHVLLPHSCTG